MKQCLTEPDSLPISPHFVSSERLSWLGNYFTTASALSLAEAAPSPLHIMDISHAWISDTTPQRNAGSMPTVRFHANSESDKSDVAYAASRWVCKMGRIDKAEPDLYSHINNGVNAVKHYNYGGPEVALFSDSEWSYNAESEISLNPPTPCL